MVATVPMMHVRYNGRSVDIPLGDLDVGQGSTDQQIKRAAAGYLDIPTADLRNYVVDRHASDNMTIRPQAVYG